MKKKSGKRIIRGLQEALAFAKGDTSKGRVTVITMRERETNPSAPKLRLVTSDDSDSNIS